MSKVKWLFAVFLMAVFVCLGTLNVRAEETEIDTSVFKYEENEDGTITIFEYYGTDETVTIPSEIDGKPVKSIGGRAFTACNTVRHIIIQEGITDIDTNGLRSSGVFSECENLETVSLPGSLKTIGDYAFYLCDKLREINLPEGLTSIGNFAFYNCWRLSNINLPEGLVSIGQYSFWGCSSIKKLIVPDSVIQIGKSAFLLTNYGDVFIYGNPDSYAKKYVDEDPRIKFSCINHSNIVTDPAIMPTCTENGKTEGTHCTVCGTFVVKPQVLSKRHKIIIVDQKATCTESGEYYTYCEVCGKKNIDENGMHVVSIGTKVTAHKYDNGIILSAGIKTYTCTVCGKTKTEKVPIPRKGKTISDSSNSYKVILPVKYGKKNATGAVEYIETKSSKTSITIPNTVTIDSITYKVTSIAKNAFKNNKKLKNVTIGSNITNIKTGAFSGCKNLKTITIKSKNIESVGKNAFKGINAKAKIKVPSSELTKYKKLFAGKGQKSSVKIKK